MRVEGWAIGVPVDRRATHCLFTTVGWPINLSISRHSHHTKQRILHSLTRMRTTVADRTAVPSVPSPSPPPPPLTSLLNDMLELRQTWNGRKSRAIGCLVRLVRSRRVMKKRAENDCYASSLMAERKRTDTRETRMTGNRHVWRGVRAH